MALNAPPALPSPTVLLVLMPLLAPHVPQDTMLTLANAAAATPSPVAHSAAITPPVNNVFQDIT